MFNNLEPSYGMQKGSITIFMAVDKWGKSLVSDSLIDFEAWADIEGLADDTIPWLDLAGVWFANPHYIGTPVLHPDLKL